MWDKMQMGDYDMDEQGFRVDEYGNLIMPNEKIKKRKKRRWNWKIVCLIVPVIVVGINELTSDFKARTLEMTKDDEFSSELLTYQDDFIYSDDGFVCVSPEVNPIVLTILTDVNVRMRQLIPRVDLGDSVDGNLPKEQLGEFETLVGDANVYDKDEKSNRGFVKGANTFEGLDDFSYYCYVPDGYATSILRMNLNTNEMLKSEGLRDFVAKAFSIYLSDFHWDVKYFTENLVGFIEILNSYEVDEGAVEYYFEFNQVWGSFIYTAEKSSVEVSLYFNSKPQQ